jgi:hypothetical protein
MTSPEPMYIPTCPGLAGLAAPACRTPVSARYLQPHRAPRAAPAPTPALTGPIQIIQGSQLVNGVYLGFPHTTQGAPRRRTSS